MNRWKRGGLADEVASLVFAVGDYLRPEVRALADKVQALEDEVRTLRAMLPVIADKDK